VEHAEEEIEKFSGKQIIQAVKAFLEYGEQSFVPDKPIGTPGHSGYFNDMGWAARCLRYHLTELEKSR